MNGVWTEIKKERQTWIHVVIPVYNAKKYLKEAVCSVLEQPYCAIRIVLVDDGSTDGSSQLCDELATEFDRIHVIHQANAGVSTARNTGIEFVLREMIDSDYIAFLDADDMWVNNFFDANTIEYLHKWYDLIGFQCVQCNGRATRFERPRSLVEGVYAGSAANVWNHSTQVFGSMLYSARLLRKYSIRFPDGVKINEDLIFRMQCMYLCDTYYLTNRILYLYRKHPASVSHQKKTAIAKYLPVMRAWIDSDIKMERLAIREKGKLVEGHAMAAVYVVDMYQEHYQLFGRKRELDTLMTDDPEIKSWIECPLAEERLFISNRWKEIQEHPFKFRLRCYAQGVKNSIAWRIYLLLYCSKTAIGLVDKIRFPHPIETINQPVR